jgi:phage/plasmid-associated DNA primase
MASLLDGIINTIFGPPTSAMTPKDAAITDANRKSDQKGATGEAFNAMNDQGESYIDGSQAVKANPGDDLFSAVGKIFKLFAPSAGA